ncbi:MAG: hypothetical protein KDC97_00835 [Confluentibacter sp.]|jgi:hypothetical protein|nr:hypothetical protein [Confluentibacter sp.]HMR16922.1 hypothetical protein [Mariniflexile sp.]
MKQRKSQVAMLDEAIAALKYRRQLEYRDLKAQFYETSQVFKPATIINQTIKDFRELPELKSNFLKTVLSIAGGYFSKKIVLGKSNSFIKSILGYVLQYGVTNFISKKVSDEPENAQ